MKDSHVHYCYWCDEDYHCLCEQDGDEVIYEEPCYGHHPLTDRYSDFPDPLIEIDTNDTTQIIDLTFRPTQQWGFSFGNL